MARPEPRRLIVNADDFGRSSSINLAVVQAHLQGILTTASLMVNEPACAEAVQHARDHPRLGVGLHLVLACGRAALSPGVVPDLVDSAGRFPDRPVGVGLRYFARHGLRHQLRQELMAQFERFHATGLNLDHVNGHLHLHLHPVVFDLLMEHAKEWGVTRARLTREPFWLAAKLGRGRWAYRMSHAAIFQWLARNGARRMRQNGIRHSDRVFGLLEDGKVDEAYLLRLLQRLPGGDSELYSHPSCDQFKHELDALVSPQVRTLVEQLGIGLIRYQDL